MIAVEASDDAHDHGDVSGVVVGIRHAPHHLLQHRVVFNVPGNPALGGVRKGGFGVNMRGRPPSGGICQLVQ